MYERLKKLYREGSITEAGLQYWVDKGAITQEQMEEIINGNEEPSAPEFSIEEYAMKVHTGEMSLEDVPSQYRDDVFLYLEQL